MPSGLDFYINFNPDGAVKGVDAAVKQAKRAEAEYRKASVAVGKFTGALDVQRAKVKQQEAGLSILADKLAIAKKAETDLAATSRRAGKTAVKAKAASVAAVKKLTAQYEVQEARVKQASAAADQLAGDLERVKTEQLNLAASSKKATAQSDKLQKEFNQQSVSAKKAAAGAEELDRKLKKVSATEKKISGKGIKALVIALATGLAARKAVDIIMLADSYTLLNAKVKIATDSTEEYRATQALLHAQSQDSRSLVTENTALYSKLQLSLKDTGLQGSQTLSIVDLLNKSHKIYGTTMQESTSFNQQFVQSMGKGKLEGDELKTMLEANSYFAGRLAEAIGVATGELKDMGADGLLTTELMLEAFPKMAARIEKDFKQMPITIRDAVNTVVNAFGKAINKGNETADGTSQVAEAIVNLGRVLGQNQGSIADFFAILIKGAEGGVRVMSGLVGVLLTLESGFHTLEKGSANVLAAMSLITDKAGLTSGEYERWRDVAKQAGEVGEKAAGKAAKAFASMAGEQQKSTGKSVDEIKKELLAIEGKKDVIKAVGGTVKEASKEEIKFLKEKEKEWKKYLDIVEEANDKLTELGSFGGTGQRGGIAKINGEWQNYADNAQIATSLLKDFNNTAFLGTGQIADKIFELSLAGKSDLEVWEARKRAAEKYTEVAQSTAAEVKALYAAGDTEAGAKKLKELESLTGKAESAYSSLAREVTAEFTPAMEAAHDKAKEGVKGYEKAAKKSMAEAKKHYKSAEDAAKSWGDKQLDLEAKLADIGRKQAEASAKASGSVTAMASAARASYNSMVSEAEKYEDKAFKAFKAGDFDQAAKFAEKAVSAWDSLGSAVEAGGKQVITATEALGAQARGIKSAGELGIKALQAKEKAEEKAGKAAEAAAKKSETAKAREAEKVKKLEADKEKVIVSAEEGAQRAAQGTLELNDLLTQSYRNQAAGAQKLADVLDQEHDFSGAQAAAKDIEKYGKIIADRIKKDKKMHEANIAGSATAKDASIKDIEAIGAAADRIAEKKRVIKMEIREVSGASGGAAVGVQGAAFGAIAGGMRWADGLDGLKIPGSPSRVDTMPFFLAMGETVTNADAAQNAGYDTWKHINNKNMIGAAQSMVAHHPHLQQIFAPPVNIQVAQPQQQQGGSLPSNMVHVRTINQQDGRITNEWMSAEDLQYKQQYEQRVSSNRKRFQV